MHIRMRSTVVAALSVGALLGSACGGAALDVASDPHAAVSTAFRNTSEWEGVQATFRVDSDVESLVASAEGDPDVTPDVARAVLASFVRIQATSGDDPADTADDELALTARIDDIDAFEARAVDSRLFLRAEVRRLVERFDTSGTGEADLDQAVVDAQGFGLDFADEAVDGAWLELVGIEQVASMVSGMAGVPSPEPEEAASAKAAIDDSLQRFVDEQVTVVYVGREDAGERVRLTATGTALLDLFEELLAVAGPVATPAFAAMDPREVVDELRREVGADAERFTLPVELWIDGDTISRVGFDLVAFFEANRELLDDGGDGIPEGLERLAIVVDLEEFTGGVEAPDDAVEVDVFALFGRMMSGFGAAFGQESVSGQESVTLDG